MKVPIKIITKPTRPSWEYGVRDIEIDISYKIDFKKKKFIIEAVKEAPTTDGMGSFPVYYKISEGSVLEEAIKNFLEQLKEDKNIKNIEYVDIDKDCIEIC